MMPRPLLAFVLAAAVGVTGGVSGETTAVALSDPDRFMAEVRQRLEDDEARQRGFVFLETRREQKLDGSGRPTEQSVKVFESYPGLPGERRWRRLVEEDGQRLPASALERQDRERRAHVEAHQANGDGAGDTPRGRNDERIEDAFRVFRFDLIGRERRDGHDALVFALRARPDARPKTREGRVMRYFEGRAWVSESDYELMRLEAEATRDVSIGLGLLGRVHQGSRFSFERRQVDNDTWLPVRSEYTASARVLLVRRIHMTGTTEYSHYRRVPDGMVAAGPITF
jgi:hypothetical protein